MLARDVPQAAAAHPRRQFIEQATVKRRHSTSARRRAAGLARDRFVAQGARGSIRRRRWVFGQARQRVDAGILRLPASGPAAIGSPLAIVEGTSVAQASQHARGASSPPGAVASALPLPHRLEQLMRICDRMSWAESSAVAGVGAADHWSSRSRAAFVAEGFGLLGDQLPKRRSSTARYPAPRGVCSRAAGGRGDRWRGRRPGVDLAGGPVAGEQAAREGVEAGDARPSEG